MTAVETISESTTFSTLDQVVQRVRAASEPFAQLTLGERIALADDMRRGYREIAAESVRAACRAKGIAFDSPTAGEEWLTGPMAVLRNLRLLIQSLEDIRNYGAPRLPQRAVRQLPDGRLAVRVAPANTFDAILFRNTTAEIYLQAGITESNLRDHQATFYRSPHRGRVCVVLGGGNVNSIPSSDCIHKLFVEGTVCILKMNPVNAYLGPFIERAFRTAIDKGYLAVVYGGAEEGSYLLNHSLVDEAHITGSDRSFDAIVWGPPGPEREARKAKNDPLLKKKFTSELGNVSPVVIVPGPYTDAELDFQAANIAGMVTNNASFNCNAAKLLVLPTGWPQGSALMERVARELAKARPRMAYYPGAIERFKTFTDGRAGVQLIGQPGIGELPWGLIPDVDAKRTDDRVFRDEPFCSVLSQTSLGSADPVGFIQAATRFLSETLWGTLNAAFVVHPSTLRQAQPREAFETAVRNLEYGTIGINTWPALGFAFMSTPWGGHPSSDPQDIQSGVGFVHNTYMLEGIEKCVIRGPLRSSPRHPWFPGNNKLNKLGQRLAEFEYEPSWSKLPGVIAAAL